MSRVRALWPFQRPCSLVRPEQPSLIGSLWQQATQRIVAIRERLTAANLPTEIATIGLCGSLARMEATAHSDVDLIVVSKSLQPEAERRRLVAAVWRLLADLGYELPRADGIFSQAIASDELCDATTLGTVDEAMATFGCRMQLLLEAQPVLNDEAYNRLSSDILVRRYASLDQGDRGSGGDYLLNDLLRYYRAMRIACQGQDAADAARWRLRNIKVRHSRRTQYCGMIVLLSQSQVLPCGGLASGERRNKLLEGMRRTPLERVLTVADSRDDDLVHSYDRVLRTLADVVVRDRLLRDETGEQFARHDAYRTAELELDALCRCLTARLQQLDGDSRQRLLL